MQFAWSLCTLSHTPGRSSEGIVLNDPSVVWYAQSSITCSDRRAAASGSSLSCRSLASFSLRIDT
jgi:hypothetical protein